MTIKATLKVVKIGDSAGIIIPAKQLKQAGIQVGDAVEASISGSRQPDAHTLEVVTIAQQLIKRHQTALKNLSQR